MTSAFESRDTLIKCTNIGTGAAESETEDEEVRMNCIGGFRYGDSDFETAEDELLTDDDEVEERYDSLCPRKFSLRNSSSLIFCAYHSASARVL
jgi:hypothetical protein